MSLVGSQRYSDEGCTDVDYVELMSNQSSSFPSSATGEKPWYTIPEETMGWSSPLLPTQKASMPWLTITVRSILKSPEVDLSLCSSAKQGFLPSFNYSSHRSLVPKNSCSWKYSIYRWTVIKAALKLLHLSPQDLCFVRQSSSVGWTTVKTSLKEY